jgi:tetratricopeptide (TPR) repeat protein
MQDFGRALRRLRERARRKTGRKLTCRELAKLTGYSRSAISNWLGGKRLAAADCLGDLLVVLDATAAEQQVLATARDDIEERRRMVPNPRRAPSESAPHAQKSQPSRSPLEVKYSLPPDTAMFTGRDEEIERITTAVSDAVGAGRLAAIHAFSGMPGVGKTALAVHVAHLVHKHFPDWVLFIDLHGYTPGRDPALPERALAGLLAAIGVDSHHLPQDLETMAALWRERLAGQRALLVLDNAADTNQVTPLLPGSDGCLVLVTSRRYLGDLPGLVLPLQLEALTPDDAHQMFVRLAPPAAEQSNAVTELVRLAGYLPLAVSLLARVRARYPHWSMSELIQETRTNLLTLTAEKDSVAAAFEVSYRHLPPGQQRLFRLMGLHPGTTIDAYAAAALAGLPLKEAAGHLDALHGEGLLTETCYRRYRMHDLIREYAVDCAVGDPGREQALDRLLSYYQHAAALAEAVLARQTPTVCSVAVPDSPFAVPDVADRERALAWARSERGNILACLDYATRSSQHARIIGLTAGIAALLRQDGPWPDAITRHTTAMRAAAHLDNRPSQARVLTELGVLQRLTGDYPAAEQMLQAALDIYHSLGDQVGRANALTSIGAVRRLTGDYRSAQQAQEAALDAYRSLGDLPGQANALVNLAIVRRQTGDYPAAEQALQKGLDIVRELGDRLGQAGALSELGVLRRLTGNFPAAQQVLQAALDIYHSLGDRVGQANVLCELGIVHRQTGDFQAAAEAMETALGVYRVMGDQGGQAETLNDIGALHLARDDSAQADAYHQQALDLARDIGSSWDEAHALAGLGRCALVDGRIADAQNRLQQALTIFRQIGAAQAGSISVELYALTHDPTTA